jgi:(1->4)-alpha-D-glucan 1-alpha-D-glucosylmutase
MLGKLEALGDAPGDRLREIFDSLGDGRAKLWVIRRLLKLRAEREALFRSGGYNPVRATGARARNLVAFARPLEGATCITVAPRLVVSLGIKPGDLPCGDVWGDTRIELPFVEARAELTDVITGTKHRLVKGGIELADLLRVAPVAVLVT